MKGYAFDREQETNNFYRLGNDGTIWCCSGDLAKIDADGGVYITGRITRQISRRNFKFCPAEVEELVVGNVKGVDSCVVVARPDEIEENVPVLYYTVKPEFQDLSGIIEEEIKAIFPGYYKYISRGFDTKSEVMEDREVASTKCYLCHRNLKKKIKWNSSNGKNYNSISYCDVHGYIKYKCRIKKSENGKYYAVKTSKFITEEKMIKLQEEWNKGKEEKKIKNMKLPNQK